MLGKRFFDELARQLGPRSSRRNSGPRSAKTPVTLSDPPTERTRAPEPNVATLLSLVSFGFVATATMVVFLGLGFFLLVVHPNEELNAGSSARTPARRYCLAPGNGCRNLHRSSKAARSRCVRSVDLPSTTRGSAGGPAARRQEQRRGPLCPP